MMVWDYAGAGDPDFYVDGENMWKVQGAWGPEGGFRGHRANLPARIMATRDPLTYTGAHSP